MEKRRRRVETNLSENTSEIRFEQLTSCALLGHEDKKLRLRCSKSSVEMVGSGVGWKSSRVVDLRF